jgi:hypothetical protein
LTRKLNNIYRDVVVFSIQNGGSVSLIDDSSLSGTVGALFAYAKSHKLLSDRDEKAHAISMCLYIYSRSRLEIMSYLRLKTCISVKLMLSLQLDSTDDDETPMPKSTVCRVPVTPKSCKRKRKDKESYSKT